MIKVTFKKQPRSKGLASVGEPYPSVDIKINKKCCGYIAAPTWMTKDNKWAIRLMVESDPQWKWVNCTKRFDSEQEAREATPICIQAAIDKGYTLRFSED